MRLRVLPLRPPIPAFGPFRTSGDPRGPHESHPSAPTPPAGRADRRRFARSRGGCRRTLRRARRSAADARRDQRLRGPRAARAQAREPGPRAPDPAVLRPAVADARRLPLLPGRPGPEHAWSATADPLQPQAPRRPLPGGVPVLPHGYRPLALRRRAVGRGVHGLPLALSALLRRV